MLRPHGSFQDRQRSPEKWVRLRPLPLRSMEIRQIVQALRGSGVLRLQRLLADRQLESE